MSMTMILDRHGILVACVSHYVGDSQAFGTHKCLVFYRRIVYRTLKALSTSCNNEPQVYLESAIRTWLSFASRTSAVWRVKDFFEVVKLALVSIW
jgi:hypothetical protein